VATVTDSAVTVVAGDIGLTGNVAITGPLTVSGNITGAGTIIDALGNSANHKH